MCSNKNIVIIAAVFPPEPVVSANMAFDVASDLSTNNNVIVLSPNPTRPSGMTFSVQERNLPFRHIILGSYTCPESKPIGRLRESISFGKATAQYIRDHHDSIQAVYADTWPLFAQMLICRELGRYKIPLLLHVQDIYPDSFSKKLPRCAGQIFQLCFLPLDKYVLNHSTDIIGISPYMIDFLSTSRNIRKEKFMLVRNWQNDTAFQDQYHPVSSTKGKRRFMFLGSVNPTASVETVIKAFAEANLPEAKLSIVGTGPDVENCRHLATDLGIEVDFYHVDATEVARIQGEADVLLLPLKKGIAYTATPSKLTAYLFSGRPVIAALEKDSDAGNIILSSKCGVVVPSEDSNVMAEAMRQFNEMDVDDLNTMGASGFSYAKSHLSREANKKLIVNKILSYRNV